MTAPSIDVIHSTPGAATRLRLTLILLAILGGLVLSTTAFQTEAVAQVRVKTKILPYTPPRPPFAGFHVGMSQDSAFLLMQRVAARKDTLHVDSLILLESDSIRIFGQAAYIQLQITHKRVRTVVINFHPLGGDRYTNLRDQLDRYLESYFGRGVVLTNESIQYHRWETEDGTSEVSHSDKYMRVFVRLGKPRV